MRHLKNYPFVAIFLFLFVTACVNKNEDQKKYDAERQKQESSSSVLSAKERLDRAKRIYSLLPTPLETSVILKEAGAIFDSEILNSTDKAYDYHTALSQGLNLGIYGTDLSFAAAYGRESEVVMYFSAVKKLSDDLHISNTFTEDLMQKVEENINNRNELMKLISDAYWSANNDLTADQRASISTLVIAGGWIEAMYIAVKLADNDFSKTPIVEKIGEQKHTLELLMELIEDAKSDKYIQQVYQDFKDLEDIYAKLQYTGEAEDVEDPVSGEIKAGILKKVDMSPSSLNQITKKVVEMREMYVSLN